MLKSNINIKFFILYINLWFSFFMNFNNEIIKNKRIGNVLKKQSSFVKISSFAGVAQLARAADL